MKRCILIFCLLTLQPKFSGASVPLPSDLLRMIPKDTLCYALSFLTPHSITSFGLTNSENYALSQYSPLWEVFFQNTIQNSFETLAQNLDSNLSLNEAFQSFMLRSKRIIARKGARNLLIKLIKFHQDLAPIEGKLLSIRQNNVPNWWLRLSVLSLQSITCQLIGNFCVQPLALLFGGSVVSAGLGGLMIFSPIVVMLPPLGILGVLGSASALGAGTFVLVANTATTPFWFLTGLDLEFTDLIALSLKHGVLDSTLSIWKDYQVFELAGVFGEDLARLLLTGRED